MRRTASRRPRWERQKLRRQLHFRSSIGAACGHESIAGCWIDRGTAPAPDPSAIGPGGPGRVEDSRLSKRGHIDRPHPAAVGRDVAEASDHVVQPRAGQREAAPDVLVPGVGRQPDRPAWHRRSGSQVQRVQPTVAASHVDPGAPNVKRGRRGSSRAAAGEVGASGQLAAQEPLPQHPTSPGIDGEEGTVLAAYVDHLVDGAGDTDLGRYDRSSITYTPERHRP